MKWARLKQVQEKGLRKSREQPDEKKLFGSYPCRLQPQEQAQARLRIEQVLTNIKFPEDAPLPMYHYNMKKWCGT